MGGVARAVEHFYINLTPSRRNRGWAEQACSAALSSPKMSAVPPKNGPVADTFRRHWRFYRTEGGADAVRRELDALDAEHAAALIAEMRIIARSGFRDGGARHLRGRIWEVRADSFEVTLRALFAKQGRYGQVLLALHVFKKKTQQTPHSAIELAEKRLRDWTRRSIPKRVRQI
jgi:phage-related protein